MKDRSEPTSTIISTTTTHPDSMLRQESPFLNHGAVTEANTLAIIQLSKDDLVPVYLRDAQGEHDGYKEGHVLNTRFGSFPHSTLIGVPWGSQVRASNVDTGSRGRKKKQASQKPKDEAEVENVPGAEEKDDVAGVLKRKRDPADEGEKRAKSIPDQPAAPVEALDNTAAEQIQEAAQGNADGNIKSQNENENGGETAPSKKPAQKQQKTSTTAAESGFVHILPPTPELWTSSLPHRTQVVYTPDYSYVLQRIRARPGSRLIEAGSGSGSFTHASARAVYDGCTGYHDDPRSRGKVFSFEFHEQRFEKMRREINEHGLGGVVEINHRDVYNEGFLVDGKSPEADAVFLDLPAPWLALPHLSRRKPTTGADMEGVEGAEGEKWISPLNPKKSVHICTFSPCIEQVTRTVSEMRKLGWVEIDMVEIAHKRIQVFREKIGLSVISDRGAQLAPKDVTEAVARLKEIEARAAEHNAKMLASHGTAKGNDDGDMDDDETPAAPTVNANGNSNAQDVRIVEESRDTSSVKPFMQGQLVTRAEADIKAHTSYLVFAILPREWTEEDEAAAAAKWPVGKVQGVIGATDRLSRKQQKREMMQGKGKKSQKGQKGKQDSKQKPAAAKASEDSKDGDVDMGEGDKVSTE